MSNLEINGKKYTASKYIIQGWIEKGYLELVEDKPEEKYPRATTEDILKYSRNQNAKCEHHICTRGTEGKRETIRRYEGYRDSRISGKESFESETFEQIGFSWQPSPGELIEVSDDGKKWYTSQFELMVGQFFGCLGDGSWNYARPVQKKLVLPVVPDFDWGGNTNYSDFTIPELGAYIDELGTQMAILTKAITKFLSQ